MIENSSKALLNFSQLKCTQLDKNNFNIISARQKNEIEKWPLITSVQCISKLPPLSLLFATRRRVCLFVLASSSYRGSVFGLGRGSVV